MHQNEAIEPYLPVVLFIMLYKGFDSVDEIRKCDHSSKNSSAVLSYGTVCFVKLYKINS